MSPDASTPSTSSDELRDRLESALGESYRVVREMSGGGMSRVFLGREVALARDVVIKALPDLLSDGAAQERFQREILLSATLQHPNIIGVIAAGDAGGLPYFIMPFVDGESLRTRLSREGAMPVPVVVAVLRDVVRALAFAHARGVVHRDIKPDNILLTGGAAVVADFGVAKAVDTARGGTATHGSLTQIGISLGTPSYMAPEQVAADPSADHRVDIYALGITAFEMLAGRPPFQGSYTELATAHLTQAPPDLNALRPNLPAALSDLVTRCLAKDPAARPDTAQALALLLDDPAVVSGAIPSLSTQRAPKANGWWRAAIALAVLLVAGAAWRFLAKPATSTMAPSVAVLPFANSSSDSSDAYLALGLTDELTNALTRVRGLRVASRATATALASAAGGPAQAAAGQAISMLLEGSVQVMGKRVRVTARLVQASTGFATWSESYDRESSDLFAVQSDIAASIAALIRADVAQATATSVAGRGTPDAEAYDQYLRGHFLLARRGGSALAQAAEHFERAIALDSTFAPAFAELAQTYAVLPLYTNTDPGVAHARARRVAEQALARDSQVVQAHAALGYLSNLSWKWSEGRASLMRALALDSTYVVAHQWLGENLLLTGDAGAAVASLRRARDLDPQSAVLTALYGVALSCIGDAEAAVREGRAAVAADPNVLATRFMLGTIYADAGRWDEALTELQAANQQVKGIPTLVGAIGYVVARQSNQRAARDVRRQLELLRGRPGVEAGLAKLALGEGRVDDAVVHLKRAADVHDGFFGSEPLCSPIYAPLRSASGMDALRAQVGLPR